MSAFAEDESFPRRKLGAEQHTKNVDAGRLKLPARKRKNEEKRGKMIAIDEPENLSWW